MAGWLHLEKPLAGSRWGPSGACSDKLLSSLTLLTLQSPRGWSLAWFCFAVVVFPSILPLVPSHLWMSPCQFSQMYVDTFLKWKKGQGVPNRWRVGVAGWATSERDGQLFCPQCAAAPCPWETEASSWKSPPRQWIQTVPRFTPGPGASHAWQFNSSIKPS